ncbi:glycoside hydrolase family 3 protein [Vagococcus sp. DIV0080]|uniref:beta-N-acetylhexosaminidase n=1 Tax=Candidatus Vagococcus giribetii TaxID=2230876 RepID=A0ABS3HPN6_9ENTE|nr:glycoside hydrolase family 3 protein [Vagococcus sp. DIV0080]MBO0475708.1 glycoside hydrolase family 3 protein [Vagococcus sp. DIV0080]
MVQLRQAPFNLDEKGIEWVEETLNKMTVEEKIGQLFCTIGMSDEKEALDYLTKEVQIGGIMYRPANGKSLIETHSYLQESSKIPLLIAANLESGGQGAVTEGTQFGMPMGVAATDHAEMGYRLGKVSCSEGAAVGINWSFAPIVDIDINFRNPITNLRTFGSSVEKVLEMSKGYLKAADEEGLAVSIKHFPGDGVDERDQHLVTSVNDLSATEWRETYGRVYQELINEGAKTVMIGHIAQPNVVKSFKPEASHKEQYTPGSLSPILLNDLLRDELGFNGLTVTDATLMVGFTSFMSRKDAVPAAIANGCDMFLFNKSVAEDYSYMLAGYEAGVITAKRLDEAVTRILGTKASLNLHEKQAAGTLVPTFEELQSVLANEEHQAWTKECAESAVTLVKDTQNLLPLDVTKHKRLYLNVIERSIVAESDFAKQVKEALEKEGFEVTLRNRLGNIDAAKMMAGDASEEMMASLADMQKPTSDFTEQFDAALIVGNLGTSSNEVTIRLAFDALGNDIPWFVNDIPTAFVSFGNPYHLLDVPMVSTFVNSYTASPAVLEATVDRLLGRAKFTGVSPVDPFCGREELSY